MLLNKTDAGLYSEYQIDYWTSLCSLEAFRSALWVLGSIFTDDMMSLNVHCLNTNCWQWTGAMDVRASESKVQD